MYKRLYQIFDVVSCSVIGSIIQETSDAPAIRLFTDVLADKSSVLSAHPADYNLLCLGELFSSGQIVPLDNPETILTGKTWKEMTNVAQ